MSPILAAGLALQALLRLASDTTRTVPASWDPATHRPLAATATRLLRFDDLAVAPAADTGRRTRAKAVEYSETYATRLAIHRALSFTLTPLFAASAYTGFVLRKEKAEAPEWTRDIHGPLAGATVVVFGMNTLTGARNMWESRKDPKGRTKRLVHGALFLAAAGGFAYVTAAGDNIYESGRSNHWHRDVALASMGVSVVSWSLMLF